MLTLTRPTEAVVIRYLIAQRGKPFSYDAQGVSRDSGTPSGFDRDQARVRLGAGSDVFECAKAAVESWKMFAHAMTTLYWPDAQIERGTTVAVQFRAGPLWSLNPCRIVYVVDEPDRFGFAYGTLPGHLERGEKSFLVARDPVDDSVWYELCAVSQPSHHLLHYGYPLARLMQARFRRLSCEAMRRAVAAFQPAAC